MCTYRTEIVEVSGSAKGGSGWFPVTTASVYLDHPVHARPGHTLNIDLLNPALGPAARAAVELEAPAARRLAEAIIAALDSAPAGLVEIGPNGTTTIQPVVVNALSADRKLEASAKIEA